MDNYVFTKSLSQEQDLFQEFYQSFNLLKEEVKTLFFNKKY